MLNIGIDFGSSNTSVSVYRRDTGRVEPMLAGMAVPRIPSVVSVKNGQMDFGRAARSRTGKGGAMTFKGFKSLLQADSRTAQRRGYTQEYTPELITKLYLENLLTKAIQYYNRGNAVDRLVVTVPAAWSQSSYLSGSLDRLETICRGYDFVREAEFVNDTDAACAFFAFNYHGGSRPEELYKGWILLIDCGGSSMDVTLARVEPCGNEEQEGLIEVHVLERNGTEGREYRDLGQAGIAYMEEVMARSIRRVGIAPPEEGFTADQLFLRAVDRLDEDIQSMAEILRDFYDTFGMDSRVKIPEAVDEFTTIEYNGKDISVPYSVMLEVYLEMIYPLLDERLERVIRYMKESKIPYLENGPDFKIAVTGGFGSFYPVIHQIENKLSCIGGDQRMRGIIYNSTDRENAVSMGAALLAERIVEIRDTAPFSIGLPSFSFSGEKGRGEWEKERVNFAIRFGESIRFGEPCFPMGRDAHPILYYVSEKGIPKIAWNRSRDLQQVHEDFLRPEYQERIRSLLAGSSGMLVSPGFSIDRRGMIFLHIRDYDWTGRPLDDHDKTVVLGRLDDMLAPRIFISDLSGENSGEEDNPANAGSPGYPEYPEYPAYSGNSGDSENLTDFGDSGNLTNPDNPVNPGGGML